MDNNSSQFNNNQNDFANKAYQAGQNTQNQFLDYMKNYMNPQMFANSMKNFSAFDFSSLSNMAKKNAEVFTTTNKMAAESLQSIMKKNSEIFQNNATEMFNTIKNVSSAKDMEQAASTSQQYIKNSFENSMKHAKEIMDMATKSSMEIFQVFGDNISENMSKSFQPVKN